MSKVQGLSLEGARIAIAVTNCTDVRLKASLAAQFHEWRSLGVSVDKDVFTLELAPHETLTEELVFDFARPFGDYMQDIHVFILTEAFALYCLTQKMISTHTALRREALVSIGASGCFD